MIATTMWTDILQGAGFAFLSVAFAFLSIGAIFLSRSASFARRRAWLYGSMALASASCAFLVFAVESRAKPRTPSISSTAGDAALGRIERLLADRLPDQSTQLTRVNQITDALRRAEPKEQAGAPGPIGQQNGSQLTPALGVPLSLLFLVTGPILIVWARSADKKSKLTTAVEVLGILSFVVGLVSMLADLNFIKVKPGAETLLTAELFEAGEPLSAFASASSAEPLPELKTAICKSRQLLKESGSSSAVVVARHDKRPLLRKAVEQFGTNAGLAQQRGDTVAQLLKDSRLCAADTAPALRHVVVLLGGPRYTQRSRYATPVAFTEALQQDRRVEVYGVRAGATATGATTD